MIEKPKTEDIFEAKSIGNQGYKNVIEAAINVISDCQESQNY